MRARSSREQPKWSWWVGCALLAVHARTHARTQIHKHAHTRLACTVLVNVGQGVTQARLRGLPSFARAVLRVH